MLRRKQPQSEKNKSTPSFQNLDFETVAKNPVLSNKVIMTQNSLILKKFQEDKVLNSRNVVTDSDFSELDFLNKQNEDSRLSTYKEIGIFDHKLKRCDKTQRQLVSNSE